MAVDLYRYENIVERLNESKLSVNSFFSSVPYPEDTAVCYVHTMVFDDGDVYYEGYAIVSVEIAHVSSSCYLVLVYDKQQNNNGYPAVCRDTNPLYASCKCLIHKEICDEIRNKQCLNYPIVMREKNSEFMEPIIRTFGRVDCYFLRCKAELNLRY